MNSFAHCLAFFDDPYFAAGTCVPDWLTACDRRCRARKKRAVNWIQDDDAVVRAVAAGVVQHHQDDYWFHGSAMFNRLNLQLAVEYREQFGNAQTMRASLISHIVIEMILDAWLETQYPGAMEAMYQSLEKISPGKVQDAVNRFANRTTNQLATGIEKFLGSRYVFDYLKDSGVHYRMNRVLQRLALEPMPEASIAWIGDKRKTIYASAASLLENHPKLR